MDYIAVEELLVRGRHGHYAKERRGTQEFSVTVRAAVDLAHPGKTDRLRHSVNYTFIKESVEKVFESAPRYLLEYLAEQVAALVLKNVRVREVTVTIKKLRIWKNAVPSVTITRAGRHEPLVRPRGRRVGRTRRG
jgi:dihydroneopterin aldolase